MQSTGHTDAQELQDVQLSLLMTLIYRVSFFRSALRVRKYSVIEIVIAGALNECSDVRRKSTCARAGVAGPHSIPFDRTPDHPT